MTLAAAAAIAAAAGVAVVAAAFALFALLVPMTGAAGAAAIVAAMAAFVVALAGLVAAARAKESRRRQQDFAAADPGLVAKLFELAKQRPFVATGAAVAAGVFALRNPALVAAVLKAFFDAPGGPPSQDRRR